MTEAEWLSAGDPQLMWEHVFRRTKPRKVALACVAFCRHVLSVRAQVNEYESELTVAEVAADSQSDSVSLAAAHRRLSMMAEEAAKSYHWSNDPDWTCDLNMKRAVEAATANGGAHVGRTLEYAIRAIRAGEDNVQRSCTQLLRDIFGNPFRPATLDPAWRTSTVVALALQMYESRDFGAMPILADALQDAGCDSEDVLAHCRGDGPHVRGCWVVDLILGKV